MTADDHLLTRQHTGLVTHQLKQFLGNAQALLRDLPKQALPPSSQNELELVINQMSLWQDLMTRFNQSPTLQLRLTEFDIAAAITQVVAEATHYAQAKKIQLRFGQTESIVVLADELLVRFILENLIDNALKFTASGGQITFSVKKGVSKVLISIRDTGVGITPSALAELRRHLQSEYNTPANISGLQVAQIILGWHNESLGIESTPGEGSIFHFSLQAANA